MGYEMSTYVSYVDMLLAWLYPNIKHNPHFYQLIKVRYIFPDYFYIWLIKVKDQVFFICSDLMNWKG